MRPKRIYYDSQKDKYYYVLKNKKIFVKVPKNISLKQLQKVNIKNIINIEKPKRVKRRRKVVKSKFEKKIDDSMIRTTASNYIFQPQKKFIDLAEYQSFVKKEPLIIQGIKPIKKEASIIEGIKIPISEKYKEEEKLIAEGRKILEKKLEKNTIEELTLFDDFQNNIKVFFKSMTDEQKSKLSLRLLHKNYLRYFKNLKEDSDNILKEYNNLPTKQKDAVNSSRYFNIFKNYVLNNDLIPEHIVLDESMVVEPIDNKFSEMRGLPPRTLPSLTTEFRKYNKDKKKDVMPSLKEKALSTKEKLEQTPSFSGSTKGEEFPAGTLDGKGKGEDGLYNNEIEKILKIRLKHFVPCIPSDKTNELLQYIRNGQKEFAFVINTNPSDSDGSGNDGYRPGHWTAVYMDNRDDYPSAEYFDPLCEGNIPKDVYNIMKKIAVKMNPHLMFKYKQNMLRRQALNNSNCGQHCIKFIEDRNNCVPFCEASGYDDFIEKHKGSDNSQDGEKDLKKVLKKYNSYI